MKCIFVALCMISAVFLTSCQKKAITSDDLDDTRTEFYTESEYNPEDTKEGNGWKEEEGVKVYYRDYIEEYKETLDAMFKDSWTILSERQSRKEAEIVCIHTDSRASLYIEWAIEYTDAGNCKQVFWLNNMETFAGQVEKHICLMVQEHYQEYLELYLEEVPVTNPYYSYVFMVRPANYDGTLPEEITYDVWNEFIKQAETPETPVCLSETCTTNAFSLYPIVFNVLITLDDEQYGAAEKETVEEEAKKRVKELIWKIAEETGDDMNLSIVLQCNGAESTFYDGAIRWSWDFIRGEQQNILDYYSYRTEITRAYIGSFW